MEHIANPSDIDLQHAVELAVQAALPEHASHVGVATDRGAVTLTGELPSHDQWQQVHHAALSVAGVHAIANDIEIRDLRSPGQTDTELAHLARSALSRAEGFPLDRVIAEVRHHVVTLTGTVSSPSERIAAERAVIYLPGLSRINNRIKVQH